MKKDKSKRKILYISGTRADYGLIRESLVRLNKEPGLELEIVVTAMHLMPQFGRTINEIKKKDGFKIHPINAFYEKDNKESMLKFIGEFTCLLTKKIQKIKPDIILVLGDRAEMLVGAIVGAYSAIPVAHIHGGDLSSTVDEIVRHSITKLAHIHFPATRKSANRIIKMGEDHQRVYVVGAPGLDSILKEKLIPSARIAAKYKLDLSEPVLLVVQHSVTTEAEDAGRQMKETMEAIKEIGLQSIVIYPNADAGGRRIIKIIEKYQKIPFIRIYKNLPRLDYLSLMKLASVIIGNSSSGIIEAPSFYLPAVNVGMRQKGRERANNIIDVDYDRAQIIKAVQKALFDKRFKEKLKQCQSPYGVGEASKKIINILSRIKIDKELLEKRLIY